MNRSSLLTHKEHVVKMVKSIIKESDLDPYVEQMTEDLEASSLFELSKVCPFFKLSFTLMFIHLLMVVLFLGASAYEGASR